MKSLFRFVETIDLMRLVVGILILVDGYPLIFFFRETLKLAPGSSAFTAAALAAGLVLMVPFTFLRRLYRPNMQMLWMGIGFLILSILYMFLYMSDPGFKDYDREIIYYIYILVYLFLLINIPNEIIRVFIPVVVLFTLVSNLGLIYSLITDPTWAIGQRATITLNNGDEGSGNPHAFSRNAYMGAVACAIWLLRSDTNVLFRLLAFFAGVLNLVVLVLTQTRSAILALFIAIIFFLYYNVRPAQVKTAVRSLISPVPILIAVAGVVGVIVFFQKNYHTYLILLNYIEGFAERNLENIYAVLGLNAQGATYQASLDDSAANRSGNLLFFNNVLVGPIYELIWGYGYKFLYLDIPVLESLINLGLLGFFLFGGLIWLSFYYSLRVMSYNPNPLSVFLAYFFFLILVQSFTNGRPYEISFWFPLALMIRFMGVEHLFPDHLSDYHPEPIPAPKSRSTTVPSA